MRQLIIETIPDRVREDTAFRNVQRTSDRQNARIEHDKALLRVMTAVMRDDTELFKQFMDNAGFKTARQVLPQRVLQPGGRGKSAVPRPPVVEIERMLQFRHGEPVEVVHERAARQEIRRPTPELPAARSGEHEPLAGALDTSRRRGARCTSSMRIHSTDGGSALTSLSSRIGLLRYRSSTSGSSRSTYSEASESNASRIQVVLPMPRAPTRKNELRRLVSRVLGTGCDVVLPATDSGPVTPTAVPHLRRALGELRSDGFGQVMVFTQYTDTMDFLRRELGRDKDRRLMCFSGRGGEIPSADGSWRTIDRDEARRRFRAGEAEVLLCNDAAAEGLNFQFCGALINYDMPWNPMRVEQRIGRIDRLGQEHRTIRIVNLHYADTIETDVYRVLRDRIGLFQSVVGRLQPILAQLPRTITAAVLAGSGRDSAGYANALQDIELQTRAAETGGFDLDGVLDEDLAMPARPPSPVTMEDLDRVIRAPHVMPPGTEVRPLGPREYGLLAPGMQDHLRVTTDPDYYEANAESVEFWSPGNPLFQPPELLPPATELPADATGTLRDLLDSR